MYLATYFDKYKCDKGNLKHRYDRVYEPSLEHLREQPFTMLEVGVFKGASLQAWLDYFPLANFVGLDIFERVDISAIPVLNHPRVKWFKGDSTKDLPEEFKAFARENRFDIIIDDGLHTHEAQRKTFQNLIPYLKGTYFIEDVFPYHLMTETQKKNPWLVKHSPAFSDEQYELLLKEIEPWMVLHHDLRLGYHPDTYIIEVRK